VSVVAGVVAVPLDVATKQNLRRLERRTARLEREVKEIKNAMATKEDLRQYATKQVLGTAVEQLKRWPRRGSPQRKI
jgi:hypothetical protein